MTPDGEDARIDAVRYVVDPEAVAQAILVRLLAGRVLRIADARDECPRP